VAPESFEAVARAWPANREEGLDPAHAGRVLRRLERDAFPDLGRKPITEITAPEILAVIRKVEARGALDVSRRLKQSISQAFRFAIASGWATIDPTVHLTGALKPRPRAKHMPKVPLKEFPALVRAIAAYDGEPTAVVATPNMSESSGYRPSSQPMHRSSGPLGGTVLSRVPSTPSRRAAHRSSSVGDACDDDGPGEMARELGVGCCHFLSPISMPTASFRKGPIASIAHGC
jgi:hypothetical protein